MNRNLSIFAFFLGLLAVVWVAVGYLDGHPLAFSISCIIAVVYAAGAFEMWRFHANTAELAMALRDIPEDIGHLGEWLQRVPAALRNSVRLRIEGERVALPGPGITPYLVGLLVLLGMLGTFLGMVVTLNGAVLALESTTDLQTIRAALAAPVKGLGVAFGTSVAGVAASAMLGLISALCRRERLLIGQLLDSRIAGVLRDFSLTYQRQETFKALQAQSQALPALASTLDAAMRQMAEHHRQLGDQLLAGQQRFHEEARTLYGNLAQSIDQSLKASLRDSATLAAQTIEPIVSTTMAAIADETQRLHDTLSRTFDRQLADVSGQFAQTVADVSERFSVQSASLLADMRAAQHTWQNAWADDEQQRQASFTEALTTLAGHLETQWRQAGQATLAQQEQITSTLGDTARTLVEANQRQAEATIAEVTRLMQTAAEAPKAAAEVIGQLRQELSASMARDNGLLEERSRIMATLATLLDAINHASSEQRSAIDALLAASTDLLERAGNQFAIRIDQEAGKLEDIGASITGGALEVASLGEAFGTAVTLFAESNDKMMATLQRIENSLSKSLTRSDEQLAYYVAQAREIIDLSILSQKKMVDDLQRVAVAEV